MIPLPSFDASLCVDGAGTRMPRDRSDLDSPTVMRVRIGPVPTAAIATTANYVVLEVP